MIKSMIGLFAFLATMEMSQAAESITVCWATWDPSNFLEALSKDFTKETGIEVRVNQIPWENYEQVAFTNLTSKSDKWDVLIGDSQWLGRSVKEGHYIELTDFLVKNGVDTNMTPSSITAYAEYPKGQKHYWAVPVEGDGIAFAYRKDLFEDSANQKSYKAKFGRDLDVPETLEELLNIGKFFADSTLRKNPGPKEKFYGMAGYGANGAGTLTLVTEALMWNYGGSLGDYTTFQLKGHLDSKGSIKGIEMSRELFKLYPPGFSSAFFMEINNAYNAGLVPMQFNFAAFFPALVSEGGKFKDVTGFFPFPGAMGDDGRMNHFTALGGQGASIVKYSKKQEASKKWLDWFIRLDTQKKWARMGGFTCDRRVLASRDFLDSAPYNVTYAITMGMARDFWAVPEYPRLMSSMEAILGPYVTKGKGTATDAANKLLAEHTKIFKAAGYYK